MTGAWLLLRALVRRDRWQVLAWSAGISVLYWSQAVSVSALYRTPAELDRAAASMAGNPAFVAMTGPTRALDTVGGQVAWQSAAFGAVLVGLMVMFLVLRATRGAEEDGSAELVRAAPVGRHAVAVAAVAEGLAASVVVGAAVAAPLVAYPLAVADSVALGAGLALTGWCFVGLALVAAQVTVGLRAAYGVVGAGLAAAYLLRAVGDVSAPWLSWTSPIGWYQGMHAFSGLRWWPLLPMGLATAAGLLVGALLLARRDHGSGLLAERPGPARAGAGLRGGLGLAWRLRRGSVAGWATGLLLAGLAYGSIGDDVEELLGDSDTARALLAGGPDPVAAFQATALLMLALIASGFTVSAALGVRTEEEAGRLGPLLASGLDRGRWWAQQVVVTLAGSLVVLAAGGLGLAVGYGAATGGWTRAVHLVPAEIAFIAPAAVLAALTWLWHGLGAGWAVLGWTGPVVSVTVGYLGDLLDLPGWLQAVSPYEHLAAFPAQSFAWTPVLVTATVATLTGLAGRRMFLARDLV